MDGVLKLIILFYLTAASAQGIDSQSCKFGCAKDPSHSQIESKVSFIEQTFNHPNDSCENSDQPVSDDRNLAVAARLTMAMMYGSCTVLEQKAANVPVSSSKNLSRYLFTSKSGIRSFRKDKPLQSSNHYYLKWAETESCFDRNKCKKNITSKKGKDLSCKEISCLVIQEPPVYQFGGKPQDLSIYEEAVYRGERSNTLGIDCSGFVSQAFAVQGLRFYPKGSDHLKASQKLFGTGEFAEFGLGKKDCFTRPGVSDDLKPGDILVLPKQHVLVIDALGRDPFQIDANLEKDLTSELDRIYQTNKHGVSRESVERISGRENKKPSSINLMEASKLICNDWEADASKYRITIIHSSSSSGNLGVQREKIVPSLGSRSSSGPWVTALHEQAEGICSKRVYLEFAKKFKMLEGTDTLQFGPNETRKRGVNVLRHQSENSKCRMSEAEMPVIPGLDCVRCCNTNSIYESLVPSDASNSEAKK